MTQPKTARDNLQNVQGMSKKRTRLSKSHQDYWKSRLYHNFYTSSGRRVELPELSVKIQFKKRRHTFNLSTGNREIAAAKAREIYTSLLARGWDTTVADFSTGITKKQDVSNPTVGEFLSEVERTGGLSNKTFKRYCQYFRMIVREVAGIKDVAGKFDYRSGGRASILEKVDCIRLATITPAAVADWKQTYLNRAENEPQRLVQVRRSFNTAFRNAKALFSDKIIGRDNFRLIVPLHKTVTASGQEIGILWFERISFEKPGKMKFRAPEGVTYMNLVVAARRELRKKYPQPYLLFLLCLCAGLRRAEADVLLWTQIDPKQQAIVIEANEFIQPKHDSCGPVFVDPALIKEIVSFKAQSSSEFVVASSREWKRVDYPWYRCEPHWSTLSSWLEKKGVKATKKIHELRKLFGDAIVTKEGIYAGSAQLRHSSVQMTENHYADPRKRASLPVASLLTKTLVKVVNKRKRAA